jgi:hypothetical protein
MGEEHRQTRASENTQPHALRFRAVLTKDGAGGVELMAT